MDCFMRVAEKAARAGGSVIFSRIGTSLDVERKQAFDFATQVDRESEQAIRDILKAETPSFGFLGEESVYLSAASENELLGAIPEDGYSWIVDPLDGTTNFIRGIPQFCVSIALARGREIVAGAVYDVSRGEMFSAAKGCGAFLNGSPIRVSGVASLSDAILGAAFPAAEPEKRGPVLDALTRMQFSLGSLRIYNCAALMLCYIACGRLDAGFEQGIHSWDMSAGILLIREAGGSALCCDGTQWSPLSRDHLSGNPDLVQNILPYLDRSYGAAHS